MQTDFLFQGREATGPGRITAVASLEDKDFAQPSRKLDCYALVLITRGEGIFRSGCAATQPVVAGDAFLLFPGVSHAYGPEKGKVWTEWYILFEGPLFDLWRGHDSMDPEQSVFRLPSVEEGVRRIQALAADDLTDAQRVVGLQALLTDAAAWRERNVQGDTEDAHWLKRAGEALELHLTEADAVREAAAAMGLSYQTFRKRFRDLAGTPPGAYRNGRILEQAAHQLLTSADPIKQIAENLGYCDEFHFTRRFREYHGVPPASYRHRFPQRPARKGKG